MISAPSNRVAWVDGLRTLMILFVVNMHACVTYSHVGSWYFMVDPVPPLTIKIPFALWQGHLQAFFMGLLFLIAGYFAERSASRKTTRAFIKERAIRLGIPTLLYMLVIHPLIVFGMLTPASEIPPLKWFLTDYLGKGRFLGSSGPMWFAFALLLFCIVFVLIKRPDLSQSKSKTIELTPIRVLGLGVGLGLASFLVRLVQPVGTSILNFQFCYFPQYIVAFGLGVLVCRRDALTAIAESKVARRAGWTALVLGPIAVATIAFFAMPDLSKTPSPINGGWNWEALATAMWEQTAGVGLALGAIAFSARFLAVQSPIMKWASDRSFGVYLLHAPILVALGIGLSRLHANIFLMTIILTVTGLILSFLAADIARRIPLLKNVL